MKRLLVVLAVLFARPAAAQLTVEPAGPCAAEGVSDAVKALLEPNGYRVKDASAAVFVEAWIRKAIPAEKPAEQPRGSDYSVIPPGTVLGVIRYARAGADFRGQPIQEGVYVMRFNLQPEDGDHQGASPRRDHILLSLASADADPAAKLSFDDAVALSRKASGTNHPSVLFLAAPESGAKFPGIEHGHGRDVLQVKSGAVGLGIIVVGKAEE